MPLGRECENMGPFLDVTLGHGSLISPKPCSWNFTLHKKLAQHPSSSCLGQKFHRAISLPIHTLPLALILSCTRLQLKAWGLNLGKARQKTFYGWETKDPSKILQSNMEKEVETPSKLWGPLRCIILYLKRQSHVFHLGRCHNLVRSNTMTEFYTTIGCCLAIKIMR